MSSRDQEPQQTGDPNAWMATFADLVTLLITFFVLLLSMSNLDAQDIQNSFGDADEDLQISEIARGGAPQQIAGDAGQRNRGMQKGGHRPSPSHAPEGSAQRGPSAPSPISPEQVDAALEDIVSLLEGQAYNELVEARVGDERRDRFEALMTLLNKSEFSNLFRVVLDKDRLRVHFASDLLFHPGRVRIKPGSLILLRELGRLLSLNGVRTRVIGVVQPEDAPAPIRKDLYPTQWDLAVARGCNVVRYMIDSRAVPKEQLGCVAHLFNEDQHNLDDAVIFELRSEPAPKP